MKKSSMSFRSGKTRKRKIMSFRPVGGIRARPTPKTLVSAKRAVTQTEYKHAPESLAGIIERAQGNLGYIQGTEAYRRLAQIFMSSPGWKYEVDAALGQWAVTAAAEKTKLANIFINTDPRAFAASFVDESESEARNVYERLRNVFRFTEDRVYLTPIAIAFIRQRCKEHGIELE